MRSIDPGGKIDPPARVGSAAVDLGRTLVLIVTCLSLITTPALSVSVGDALGTSRAGLDDRSAPAMAGPNVITSDDQLNWTRFGNDSQNTGHLATVGPRSNPRAKWSFTTGANALSSPVIAGDTVYVTSTFDTNVFAINRTTGEKMWTFDRSGSFYAPPTYSDGILYVTGGTKVYALNATSGDVLWNTTITSGSTTFSSPAVVNGTLYVGDDDDLHAIDASTGKRLWNRSLGNWTAPDDWISSSPAVANGTVYIGAGSNLVAFDASTGSFRWNYTANGYVGTPAIADGTVLGASCDDGVFAVNASTGRQKWNVSTEGCPSTPSVANGTVYVGAYADYNDPRGFVYAFDAETGETV
ncbi:MAG: PQQ-binding-like beta-propeller repeat protein, partial [Halobacteriaceae archaeon]